MRPESRSSAGAPRFAAITSSTYSRIASSASAAAHASSDRHDGIERLHQRVGPGPQLVAAFGRHAEHLGDHGERQREREVRDEIHLDRCHARPRASSAASTRRSTSGRSDSIIFGVNAFDTSRRSRSWSGGSRFNMARFPPSRPSNTAATSGSTSIETAFAILDAERRVAQHPHDVLVAAEHPRADQAAMHRVLLPQLRVVRVRVLGEARGERVEDRLGLRGAHVTTVDPRPIRVAVAPVTFVGSRRSARLSAGSRARCPERTSASGSSRPVPGASPMRVERPGRRGGATSSSKIPSGPRSRLAPSSSRAEIRAPG